MPDAAPPLASRLWQRARRRWRAVLRALHRDIGYILVGLTFVYAISGIAINHIDDWNPNFERHERTIELDDEVPADTERVVALVRGVLNIDEEPQSVDDFEIEVEITFGPNHIVRVDRASKTVFVDEQEERFFLRVANWLHYNRGKAAWTYIADGYAFLLLFLATSGVFMIKGRKGIVGRGALLVALGIAVPICYVHFSGGP